LLTDYLGFSLSLVRVHDQVAPVFARALDRLGERDVVDLCSGSGGTWFRLKPLIEARLGRSIGIAMTDRYPPRDVVEAIARRGDPAVRYRAEPVDARRVPAALGGMRTLFEALHHFDPPEVRAILQDAVERGVGIASVEITERTPRGLAVIAVSPLLVLAATPWIRPRRWWRFALTYAVPVAPLIVLWDGLVSCLRTYTDEELREVVAELKGGDGYDWEIASTSVRGVPLRYLVGVPRDHHGGDTSRKSI
jgi:hypothetical protein